LRKGFDQGWPKAANDDLVSKSLILLGHIRSVCAVRIKRGPSHPASFFFCVRTSALAPCTALAAAPSCLAVASRASTYVIASIKPIMRAAVLFLALAALFALASATVLEARNAEPPTAVQKRTPGPSPTAHLGKRSIIEQVPLAHPVKDAKVIELSAQLCPGGLTACPMVRPGAFTPTLPTTLDGWHAMGYECVDSASDLTSCGGCASLDIR
jgi:hypothetical protein